MITKITIIHDKHTCPSSTQAASRQGPATYQGSPQDPEEEKGKHRNTLWCTKPHSNPPPGKKQKKKEGLYPRDKLCWGKSIGWAFMSLYGKTLDVSLALYGPRVWCPIRCPSFTCYPALEAFKNLSERNWQPTGMLTVSQFTWGGCPFIGYREWEVVSHTLCQVSPHDSMVSNSWCI